MKTIKMPVEPAQIRSALVEWLSLLSQGDFEAAQKFLCRPLEREWTPGVIRDTIAGYGFPDEAENNHRVTPIPRIESRIELEIFEAGNDPIACADIELPLDGEWSDLSASFQILNEQGTAAFYLCNIRVL